MLVNKKSLLVLVSSILLVSQVSAATLTLKDGHSYKGEIQSQNTTQIVIDVSGIKMTIPVKDVNSIDLTNTTPTQVMTPKTSAAPKQKVDLAGIATLPSGTTLTVKISDGFNSDNVTKGQHFSGVLAGNLVSGNTIVAPAGAVVYGDITEAKAARRIAGSASLQFELSSVTINGTIYPLHTNIISGKGTNAAKGNVGRTARTAAIGGLIGGSDGAKNGAKVGLGLSLLTRGQDIAIPDGDIVDFTLSAPFTPTLPVNG